jgi:phage/plasmid-like protein (TIGR03299 family)
MAHEFESGFFVKEPAWHRLGKVLNNPPTTEQAIIDAGLDWTVLEEPIYRIQKEGIVEVSTHKSLVRDTDEKLLGIVSKGYHPLQNKQAFNWFDPLLHEGDVTLEAAGSLKGGKRIWVLAKIQMKPLEIQDGVLSNPTYYYTILMTVAQQFGFNLLRYELFVGTP